GGAISSPSTAETDQPTVRMSSATACMQACGSRSAPSASASHSAHLQGPGDWSGGLARRLRGGFMNVTLRGGYDIFGAAGIHAEMPLDRTQPVVDRVEQRLNRVGYGRAPRSHPRSQPGRVLLPLRPARSLRYHPRT